MLLTEEEIAYLIDTAQGRRDLVNKTIAAYEAKLREQEPVAWRKLLCFENGANEYKFSSVNVLKDGDPLYLHPAPIPEGYVLVPIEPTKEMISAMQSSGWMPGNYKAMLAAARSE